MMSKQLALLALALGTASAEMVGNFDNMPEKAENYKFCTEMDIFAEGQAFDLSTAMIEGCTDISLWNMNLEDEGNFALADAIMAQPEQIITKLDLGFNKIGPEAAQRFGKAFALPDSKLEWLNINGNSDLGVDGITALLNSLAFHKKLKTLDMGSCTLGPEAGPSVAAFVKSNTVLTELWINTNKLSTSGSQIFAALADNSAIKKLVIGGNEFGDGVKNAMQVFLVKNKVLLYIDLANNALTDTTAKHIALGLPHNNVLQTLDMDTNMLTDVGCKLIVGSLEKNTALKEFYMGANKLADDSMRKQYQSVASESDVNIRKINARRLSAMDEHDEF